jgi:hypothetical protein
MSMPHLPIERLAELGGEEPMPLEREHLASCATCAAELEAYQRLVALAGDEHRRIAPPLTEWASLRTKLIAEGLLATPDVAPASQRVTGRMVAAVARLAAVFLLLASGTVVGRMSAGMPVEEALALNRLYFSGDSGSLGTNVAMDGEEFASTAAAYAALQQAQIEYERASQYLAANDSAATEYGSEVLQKRLAALDRMAEISLAEVQERPQDPVMNQVLLTTVGAREMTLTKLGTALPVGTRLTRW